MRNLLITCAVFSVFYGKASCLPEKKQENVYVCVSNTAYAYHKSKQCRGLKKCSHKIESMTEKTAKSSYKRKPCGYCYSHV